MEGAQDQHHQYARFCLKIGHGLLCLYSETWLERPPLMSRKSGPSRQVGFKTCSSDMESIGRQNFTQNGQWSFQTGWSSQRGSFQTGFTVQWYFTWWPLRINLTLLCLHVFHTWAYYSETCDERPPLMPPKSGLSKEVVSRGGLTAAKRWSPIAGWSLVAGFTVYTV